MLKAYMVRHAGGDDDFSESAIVYHVTEEAAKEMGRHCLSSGPAYEDTEAERVPEHDARCVTQREPYQEEDPDYLRATGWGYEGEHSCDTCGLKAYGEERFGVCRVSGQCRECGCGEENGVACDHEDGFSCG